MQEDDELQRAAAQIELSVIVPTHDRSSILRATLRRLLAGSVGRPWEVVVVANACHDDTVALVQEVAVGSSVPIRIVEEARPGASVARNRGASAASGSLLVFLDDDMLVEPDALAQIVAWYDRSAGGSLLVGQVLPMPEHLATPFGAFRQRALGDVPRTRAPHEVEWYASGLAAVPAEVFRDLKGYAESYPAAGLEDVDLAARARRLGHPIVFHPGVVALHNDWAGTTARDYCRRNALYCAQGPLLAERFPEGDHSWRQVIEVNRSSRPGDPIGTRLRKGMKLAAVAAGADRWLPAVADGVRLPERQREVLYRASVSLAMFGGYHRGERAHRKAALVSGPADLDRSPGAGGLSLASRAGGLSLASRAGGLSLASRAGGLSIVIVTFNCVDEVERAIEAVQRHPPSASYEILVVDNASQDGTVARLRERFPQVRVLALDENIGYGAAANIGVKETDSDHLLLLNPDTETTAGAIDTLLRVAGTHAGVGVVGPRLVLGSGIPQSSARRLPSPWRLWLEVLRLHLLLPGRARSRLLSGTYFAQDEAGRVDWVSGACHLVPRPVWEKVGGLTERTFCGFDDLDFCWRARAAGFATWFCPEAVVVHHCSVSVGRRWTPQEIDELAINNIYVLLEDHWSWGRVKAYCAAELAGSVSELVLGPHARGLRADSAVVYRRAALARVRLLGRLLLGRATPIERHEPGLPLQVGAGGGDPAVAVLRQPLSHRVAWRLAESQLRGKTRIGTVLRGLAPETTGFVRLPSNQVFFHDPADFVAHSIYTGGYEPGERWALTQLVRPGGVVVDVGANLGIHTLLASRLVGPGGRVIAIEPGPALEALRVAVEAADCSNVTIVPLAMGADEGQAVMHVPGHHAGLASLRSSCVTGDTLTVDVCRLDALDVVPPGEIDLVKVDTEGYEAEVLAGAARWFEAGRVRSILLEVSPEFGHVDFVGSVCRRYGFAIFRVEYRKGLLYRPALRSMSVSDVESEPVQANYVLIRADLVDLLRPLETQGLRAGHRPA